MVTRSNDSSPLASSLPVKPPQLEKGVTSGVNNKTAVPSSHCEPPALDAQPGDLPLLQQILEPREGLDTPHEFARIAVAAAPTLAALAANLHQCAAAAGTPPVFEHSAHAGCLPAWIHLLQSAAEADCSLL